MEVLARPKEKVMTNIDSNNEGKNTSSTITKVYDANKIPNLSDEGILDYLSYQPKSDYRTPIKVERLTDRYAIKVTFEEQSDTNLVSEGEIQ